MVKEIFNEFESLVPEARQGKVRDFGEMKGFLSNSLVPGEEKLLKEYFRVQVTLQGGARRKAREMMRGLVQKSGWDELDNERRDLLATVDVAVRGETRQYDKSSPYSMRAKR